MGGGVGAADRRTDRPPRCTALQPHQLAAGAGERGSVDKWNRRCRLAASPSRPVACADSSGLGRSSPRGAAVVLVRFCRLGAWLPLLLCRGRLAWLQGLSPHSLSVGGPSARWASPPSSPYAPHPPPPAFPSPLTPPPPSPPLPPPTAIRALHASPTADQDGVSHQRVLTVSATAKAAAQAAVQEFYPSPSRETRHAIDIAASAASAAAVASNKIIGPSETGPPPRATRGGAGTMRKPRKSLTID